VGSGLSRVASFYSLLAMRRAFLESMRQLAFVAALVVALVFWVVMVAAVILR